MPPTMLLALLTRRTLQQFKFYPYELSVRFGSTRQLTWPQNKRPQIDQKDGNLVPTDSPPGEYEIEIHQPPVIGPIKQALIKRVPVEFHGVAPSNFNDETQWLPIYRTPHLFKLRFVIKLKLYITAISLACCTLNAHQLLFGQTVGGGLLATGLLSFISFGGLVFMGDYFRRLIVQIYVSEDFEHVRFCRFTFFGKRRDMVLPKECIIRLPETNRSIRAPILELRFAMPEKIDLEYDNYEFYELGFRIPIGLGGVLDKDNFQRALGKILAKKPGA